MATHITFNANTYDFNYYEGKGENGKTYACYGIYKNGELNSDWYLEEGTMESGVGGRKVIETIYLLYYKNYYAGVSIKDFSILEVAKVINHIINTNK
jgi:hypothetical protein